MPSNVDRQVLEPLSFVYTGPVTGVRNKSSVNGTRMTGTGRIHADLFRLLSAMIRRIRVIRVLLPPTPNGK